jgi:hypothetical protein
MTVIFIDILPGVFFDEFIFTGQCIRVGNAPITLHCKARGSSILNGWPDWRSLPAQICGDLSWSAMTIPSAVFKIRLVLEF